MRRHFKNMVHVHAKVTPHELRAFPVVKAHELVRVRKAALHHRGEATSEVHLVVVVVASFD